MRRRRTDRRRVLHPAPCARTRLVGARGYRCLLEARTVLVLERERPESAEAVGARAATPGGGPDRRSRLHGMSVDRRGADRRSRARPDRAIGDALLRDDAEDSAAVDRRRAARRADRLDAL